MKAIHTTHLLYLHGFRSSPLSTKAQKMAMLMRDFYPQVQWWCPQLPPSPDEAMQLLCDGIEAWQQEPGYESMALIGSSLGGFYATALAELVNCPAVVLNPAIEPARDLANYVGEQTSWQNPAERFDFKASYIDKLHALHAGPLKNPQNYLAVIAKGDEVLNWREMVTRYAGAQIRLIEGSDHAISDFDDHLPAVLEFLKLA